MLNDMMRDNLILQKSYDFSLKVIELYRFLREDKKEYVLSKQLLRAGTSNSGYVSKTNDKVKYLFEEIESITNILTKIVKTGSSK